MSEAAERKSARPAKSGSVRFVNGRGLLRKIWLPRFVYEALPWFYPVAAMLAIATALYIGDWVRVLPQSLVLVAACIHLSIYVLQQRLLGKKRGRHSDSDSPASA